MGRNPLAVEEVKRRIIVSSLWKYSPLQLLRLVSPQDKKKRQQDLIFLFFFFLNSSESEDLYGSLSCDKTGEIVAGNVWCLSFAPQSLSKCWSINQQNTFQQDHGT